MKSLIKFLFPFDKTERALLLFFFLFYAALSAVIVFTTDMIDSERIQLNLYFGLDTQHFVNSFFSTDLKTHFTDISHPFFRIIMSPVILLSVLVEGLLGFKAKTFFLTLITSFLVSNSLMFIFRYLEKVLKIGFLASFLLIIVTAFSSTFLIISFSPESYPVSLYLLTLAFTYYSFCIHKNEKIPVISFFTLTFLTCGTTITNGIKCFLIDWLTKYSLKEKIKRTVKVGVVLMAVFAVYYLVLTVGIHHTKGTWYLPWEDAAEQFFTYKDAGFYPDFLISSVPDMGFSYFWGNALFLGSQLEGLNPDGFVILYTRTYHSAFQYIFVGLLLLILLYAILKNFRHRLFLMLLCSFVIDVFLHVVLNFGIYESFIYGSHWIFLIPMMWGWIYKEHENKNYQKFWNILFTAVAVIMMTNNLFRIIEFIQFGQQNYPAL